MFHFIVELCFLHTGQFTLKSEFAFFVLIFTNRAGATQQPIYTEMLPGNQMLALIIPSLTESMAGEYICLAAYARTEQLEARVNIQTYGI